MISHLAGALLRLANDLRGLDLCWALIGGVALNLRSEPRFTRDLDIVVAVPDDREAERTVSHFMGRGYRLKSPLERTDVQRMATVRLWAPRIIPGDVVVDLLFASSGIEPEIAGAAEPFEVLPGVAMPVASLAHLLALKILAGRPQDLADAHELLKRATERDLQQAREALALISRRGYNREKVLLVEFAKLVSKLK